MKYTEAVTVLRRLPLLASLDPVHQKLLAFSSTYVTFHGGETLFREGDPTDSVYVIDEGEVDVVRESRGRAVTIGRLGGHQLVGEMGVFRNSPRTATIRAVGDVKALRIEADIFLKIVTESPEAAIAVMRNLSDKIALTSTTLEQLKLAVEAKGDAKGDAGR